MRTIQITYLLTLTLLLQLSEPLKALGVERRFSENTVDLNLGEKVVRTSEGIAASVERQVDRTAERIDLTLAGRRYTSKLNESHVSVRQLVSHSEGGVLRNSTDMNLNLRLPNVERRWQLRFTTYDEEEERRNLRQRRGPIQPRQREYAAGLVFMRKLGDIKTSFQPRLRLKDPLEMTYTLRFESTASYRTLFITPRLELFADHEKGTGEFFSLEMGMDLTRRLNLIITNEEEYRERGNFFRTQHAVSLGYVLTDRRGLGYSVVTTAENRPTYHMTSITTGPSFNEELKPDRLRYSLSPFLAFAKGDHFKGKAGVSLNFEVIF